MSIPSAAATAADAVLAPPAANPVAADAVLAPPTANLVAADAVLAPRTAAYPVSEELQDPLYAISPTQPKPAAVKDGFRERPKPPSKAVRSLFDGSVNIGEAPSVPQHGLYFVVLALLLSGLAMMEIADVRQQPSPLPPLPEPEPKGAGGRLLVPFIGAASRLLRRVCRDLRLPAPEVRPSAPACAHQLSR